jgi:hypothetical protein
MVNSQGLMEMHLSIEANPSRTAQLTICSANDGSDFEYRIAVLF